jgi:hypothetical protein
MLDRDRGNIIFRCNGCENVLKTGTSHFETAMTIMRREQWRSSRDDEDSDWCHYCRSCQYAGQYRKR